MTDVKRAALLLEELDAELAAVETQLRAAGAPGALLDAVWERLRAVAEAGPAAGAGPLVEKLLSKASLPEDRRLLNEKTCALVRELAARHAELLERLTLLRAECDRQRAAAACQAARDEAAAAHSARVRALTEEEAAARATVVESSAAAHSTLTAAFVRKRASIRKQLARDARHRGEKPQRGEAERGSSARGKAAATAAAGGGGGGGGGGALSFAKALGAAAEGVALLSAAELERAKLMDDFLSAADEVDEQEADAWHAIVVHADEAFVAAAAAAATAVVGSVAAGGCAGCSARWISNVFAADPAVFPVGSEWVVAERCGQKCVVVASPSSSSSSSSSSGEPRASVTLFAWAAALVFQLPSPRELEPGVVVQQVLRVPTHAPVRGGPRLGCATSGISSGSSVSGGGGGGAIREFAVVLAHGGYFAAGVFDVQRPSVPLHHKTIARYVTRRGQGGRQSGHDGRTDTAGSQLRAAMEKKWMEECSELLRKWLDAGIFDACAVLFVHAPGAANHAMILGRGAPLGLATAGGGRGGRQLCVASLPVASGRPTLAEAQRCAAALLAATVSIESAK